MFQSCHYLEHGFGGDLCWPWKEQMICLWNHTPLFFLKPFQPTNDQVCQVLWRHRIHHGLTSHFLPENASEWNLGNGFWNTIPLYERYCITCVWFMILTFKLTDVLVRVLCKELMEMEMMAFFDTWSTMPEMIAILAIFKLSKRLSFLSSKYQKLSAL